MHIVETEDFLSLTDTPLLDVRSPAEFACGHINGALSFPLFSDSERAEIGTLYKKQGREKAVLLGLEITGNRLSNYVRRAIEMIPERYLRIYCWRGGMRSTSLAWLLQTAGFKIYILKGGYKSYRRFAAAFLEKKLPLTLVGGYTGSRKTEVLHALQNMGENVLDLEQLAAHKGSAFGGLGQPVPPTNEQFQNMVFENLWQMRNASVIWVEDESRQIGSVWIPDSVYDQMAQSDFVWMEVSLEKRVQHLVVQYGTVEINLLRAAFEKITKRLGGQNVKEALEALDNGDIPTAARAALQYYDKAYMHSFKRKRADPGFSISGSGISSNEIAQKLIQWKQTK